MLLHVGTGTERVHNDDRRYTFSSERYTNDGDDRATLSGNFEIVSMASRAFHSIPSPSFVSLRLSMPCAPPHSCANEMYSNLYSVQWFWVHRWIRKMFVYELDDDGNTCTAYPKSNTAATATHAASQLHEHKAIRIPTLNSHYV